MFPADKKRVEEALSACHLPNGKVKVSLDIQKSHELEKDLFPCPAWDALGCEKPSAEMLVVAYLTLPLPGLNFGLLASVLTVFQ